LKLTAQANRLLDTEKSLQATNDALYDEAGTGDRSCQTVGDDVAGSGGVRLLGRVAAGIGIEAVENCEMLSLDSIFGRSEDVFALEVEGDSMIDDGINSGDYVLCKKASAAHNGQMVVAIVDDNDATVKRFYNEGSQVRLQPANPAFEPIYTNNCRVEAIVLGLIRRL
jgi:repressor LexA